VGSATLAQKYGKIKGVKGNLMMIYLTGDTHGEFGRVRDFCKKMGTTREDILIILGDAGINYFQGKRSEQLKEELDDISVTLFCIHGNHEQRPYAISTYEETEWHGGIVYAEENHPFILFAKDGEIYDFHGKKAIAIGGAYSVDKYYRLAMDYAWFENEQPSEEIKRYVEEQLDSCNWKVDYVLSHTAPLRYEPVEVFLPIDQTRVDKSTEVWLGQIEKRLHYRRWYCGHYHTAKRIDNLRIMFEDYGILGD
jgi:3-oxoacid CoA-transferase subunit A